MERPEWKDRIPPEIISFFEAFPGQSLLVKGRPGTGKTILALEILRAICEEGNGLYISTRMEPHRLYVTSPWIRDFIPERNIINATQSKVRRSLGLDAHHPGRTRLIDYNTILQFFRVIYEEAEDMDNPMIIFDSWDGVLSHLNIEEEAAALTQEICDFCREVETHTIFVTEGGGTAAIDFIVDGVVTLRRLRLRGSEAGPEHRVVREIEIEKVRGLPIRQSRYLFTLHGGRFRFFKPFLEDLTARIESAPYVEDRYSTGIHDLDRAVRQLPVGNVGLWETHYGVNKRYEQMLFQLCMNTVAKGGGIVGIPHMGSSIGKMNLENVVIHYPETEDINVETASFLSVVRNLQERVKKPILTFISLDTLERTFGVKGALNLLDNFLKISEETNLISSILYIAGSESSLLRSVANSVDIHLVFRDVDGALVLYGVRPVTCLYGVTVDEKGVHLTPVV
mgnify:CR=1 FL=1